VLTISGFLILTCKHPPAVVLSPASYNGRVGLLLYCPTTTQIKGDPFEVPLAGTPHSSVLADQVKSMDWRQRIARRKGNVTEAGLAMIRGKLRALIVG